jgi:cation-transporting ATPase 13A3/4/5
MADLIFYVQGADNLQPLPAPDGVDLSIPEAACSAHNYSLAVSGDAFRWILDLEDEIVVKRVYQTLYSFE